MRNSGLLSKTKVKLKPKKPLTSPTRPSPNKLQNKIKDKERLVGRQRQSWLIMGLISLVLLGGVGSRLAYLQLQQGQINRERAENNRIRILPKPPVRGNLFDRNGKVLATARLTHAAYIWPKSQRNPAQKLNLDRLASILAIPRSDLEKRINEADENPSTLIRIARGLTPGQIIALEEYKDELTGIEVDVESVRYYPNGKIGAHILGYTGELTPEEYQAKRRQGYRLGDVVGKMGVEAAYESKLRGEWGGMQLEVNGSGQVIQILGQKIAKPGQDVTLTLDLKLQKAAEAALGKRKGAIVAIDPRDGSVRAMVSYPSFDPNVFSAPITTATWKKLQAEGNPFVNRALQGFPPASTFKVVTATAGMESGKFPPNTVLNTFAALYVGGTAFGEWNRAGFGPMGFVRAMAMSSNTFHGQIGRGVGGPALIAMARRYGFGQKTGIELAEETPGLIADRDWKLRNFKNWDWSVGDTINMSIGQGFTLATPLQVAVMFAVPANGGFLVKPHLLQDARDVKEWRKSLNMKPSTLDTLRKSLRAVVAEGTGRALSDPALPPVAGKSGTAEAPPGQSHAWFGAFAPFDKPEIVVVAFAEHSGGGGGKVAAPMVRQVMEAYFNVKPKEEKPRPKP
ncbi:MAG: penicillin-binding protein 2 [Microcystis wesenbergii TW10]|uniref:Penicillin-binding protein 2 n=2 Tax=Microcystis wesenbergii TaxID=44823 RepID=A0ABU3HLN8_9CHRO|nr:penicillin-binding protein 2 [Microcystis wesenbergii]MDT3675434.1 penicillin-binding protein 2 [Microcystis wesenbergii NRERC-220]REJ57031.1 MAG: penicillin-binding protein 2 [Microcystis wesenbergii TW10]